MDRMSHATTVDDVYVVTADDATPSERGAAPQWIQLAARVFPALSTVSKAKRERRLGRLTLNSDAFAPTNRSVVAGDRIVHTRELAVAVGSGDASSDADAAERRRWCQICERQGLRVVYDGESFAVVVKPVGIHVKGRGTRNVETALPVLLRPPAPTCRDALPVPHAVHRLDYRVGGLLLVAKTRRAEVALSAQFEQHEVVKQYRAILVGRVDDDAPLLEASDAAVATASTPARAVRVTNQIDGKDATTSLLVRALSRSARYDWLSTVDLWPLTGRWHQLRLHAAALGHPIVGDDLHHGAELPDVVRGLGLFLVAVGLRFRDADGNVRSFAIDEPPKFARFRHFSAHNWRRQEQPRDSA
ncbi:hypothetical protein P43SY_003615 [Pythium insidiosum]|uniref:Pseudouridine synthase RsuA/RluA-like domain-containing protein n=1 Tax=Pythium insidiosum TaxID=114742 RepID=A0AAD5Q8Q9_PYTIN|nr:hypothetical protein P43SY_003615 [Pythium insidiosum]KAJ0409510.1 hypothetical protein ATCC90586_009050 [Pythium insidiosum]